MKVLFVLSFSLLLVSVVFLLAAILSSQQALSYHYEEADCRLAATTTSFVESDADWIGVSYMVPNLTKLQLDLNTRVKASKYAILAYMLNGTGA